MVNFDLATCRSVVNFTSFLLFLLQAWRAIGIWFSVHLFISLSTFVTTVASTLLFDKAFGRILSKQFLCFHYRHYHYMEVVISKQFLCIGNKHYHYMEVVISKQFLCVGNKHYHYMEVVISKKFLCIGNKHYYYQSLAYEDNEEI